MWKECKIIMLPTEKEANIGEFTIIKYENEVFFDGKPFQGKLQCGKKVCESTIVETRQHLYILSDDEIKKEEFDILLTQGLYFESSNGMIKVITANRVKTLGVYKKIIATTDSSLFTQIMREERADNTGGTNYVTSNINLPRIPEEFIQLFIQKYNSGEVIDKVLVKYETDGDFWDGQKSTVLDYLKVDSENKINIKLPEEQKQMFSREEVIEIAWNAWYLSSFQKKENTTEQHFKQWIQENLK